VARSGRLPVVVDDSAALRERLAGPAFDYTREWPLRVGLVTTGEQARQIVLVFCHAAADWHGITVALRDLRALLRGSALPAPGPHPLDLARWQLTEGRAQTARAVGYWTAACRTIPPAMFTVSDDPSDPPYQQAVLTSLALDGAARVVAARQHVSTAAVLLAGTAALVRAWTGHDRCALNTLVHNRFQPGHAGIVGMLAQNGLVVVDLAGDLTFAEAVDRTWRAALVAYRNAYYDQAAVDGAVAQVSQERGTQVNPYCCFNDQRPIEDAGRVGTPPSEADVRAAFAATTLTSAAHGWLNCRFCLRLEPAAEGLRVLLLADRRCLAADTFLDALERLVVEAAFGEVRLDELSSARSEPPGARR
jgi:hypothetical protein